MSRSMLVVALVCSTAATLLLVLALTPFRDDLRLINVGFLFLLLTLLIASYWGREVGLFAAVVSNLAFNFFFIDPLYQFMVDEPRNALALVIFLFVLVLGGTLISMARESTAEAKRRQVETEVALDLSRAVSGQDAATAGAGGPLPPGSSGIQRPRRVRAYGRRRLVRPGLGRRRVSLARAY